MDDNLKFILLRALRYFGNILEMLILIRVILSWVRIDRNNIIVKTIHTLTEPILSPIRKLIYKSPIGSGLMLDFSPIIAYVLITIVINLLSALISGI